MPHHHLVWDATQQGDIVFLEIEPDPQVSVNGSLRVNRNGAQSPKYELLANDLVPGWKHTLGAKESLHLTLTFSFVSEKSCGVAVKAWCQHPDGSLHQGPAYEETYSGKQNSTTDVFVWASR